MLGRLPDLPARAWLCTVWAGVAPWACINDGASADPSAAPPIRASACRRVIESRASFILKNPPNDFQFIDCAHVTAAAEDRIPVYFRLTAACGDVCAIDK